VFQTKRWNEAIRLADLKAQSPSLAIIVRVLFGGGHQGDCVLRRAGTSPLPCDFEVGRGGVSFAGQSRLPFCGAAGSFPALAQTQAAL
jgi:hypothetical protein